MKDKILLYQETKKLFSDGLMTEEEWYNFCDNLLEDIIKENTDVLIRLKEDMK